MMRKSLPIGILIASLGMIVIVTSCMAPIPDTGKIPIINPDEVIPVAPKPLYPPPPPEVNPYARREPSASDNSEAVLSERAKESWDRLLKLLEPQGEDASANSTAPKVEPPLPPAPAPVVVAPNPAPVAPIAPPPAQSVNVTAPQPSATPALNAARNLTGTWAGSGSYYYMDIPTGRRVMTVTEDVVLIITQKDNTVTADMRKHVTKQEPSGEVVVKDPGAKEARYSLERASDWNGTLAGRVSATSLSLTTTSTVGYTDVWQFTFTTDLMSGGVRTEMGAGVPYEIKSEPKAFILTRQR